MQRGLVAVSIETKKVDIQFCPDKIALVVHNLDGPLRLPTHVLAIRDKSSQNFDLYPIHDVLFASHCAYLPYFRAPNVPLEVETHNNGTMVLRVPVVKYELPDPKSFFLMYNYLYRHDVNALLGSLLPPLSATLIQYVVASTSMTAISGRVPSSVKAGDAPQREHEDQTILEAEAETVGSSSQATSSRTSPASASTLTPSLASLPAPIAPRFQQTPEQKRQQDDLNKLAQLLANTFALPRLLQQARLIHGVWSNVIMLGIADVGVWNSMDYAWSVMMKSLVIATDTLRRQQLHQQASALDDI